MDRTTRKPRPEKRASDTCPKCGYCDKCGRSNAVPAWPYPVIVPAVPQVQPWWRPLQPYPTYPGWWDTTTTVSGTSTAAAQPGYIPSVYNVSGLSFDMGDYGLGIPGAPTTDTVGN